MSREERIVSLLTESLKPQALEIVNESHMHSGPRTESHYKVFVVAKVFEGLSRVERQQKVYALVDQEFKDGLHALSLRLKSPEEVENSKNEFISPNCKHKP